MEIKGIGYTEYKKSTLAATTFLGLAIRKRSVEALELFPPQNGLEVFPTGAAPHSTVHVLLIGVSLQDVGLLIFFHILESVLPLLSAVTSEGMSYLALPSLRDYVHVHLLFSGIEGRCGVALCLVFHSCRAGSLCGLRVHRSDLP